MNKYLDYAFHLRILHLKVGKINIFELRFLPLYSTLMNYFNAFYSETIQDPLNQWNFKENGILQAPEEQRKYLKKIPYSLSANRATANHSQSYLHIHSNIARVNITHWPVHWPRASDHARLARKYFTPTEAIYNNIYITLSHISCCITYHIRVMCRI